MHPNIMVWGMRGRVVSVCAVLFFVALLMPCTAASQDAVATQASEHLGWIDSFVDDYSWNAETISMTSDPQGHCHIAYFDRQSFGLKYATDRSGSWNVTLLEQGTEDYPVGNHMAICVDTQGTVHIAYHAEYYQFDGRYYVGILRYATNSGGDWSFGVIDDGGVDSHSVGWRVSITVDALGAVHVVYGDGTWVALMYATNANGTWAKEMIVSPPSSATYSQVAVEVVGEGPQAIRNVHILYTNVISTSFWLENLCYINRTGQGPWSQPFRVDPTENTGRHVSMAMASNGTIYASYLDAPNIKIRVAWGKGTQWSTMEAPRPSDMVEPWAFGMDVYSYVAMGPSGPKLAYLVSYSHLNATGGTVTSSRLVLVPLDPASGSQQSTFEPEEVALLNLVGMELAPSGRAIMSYFGMQDFVQRLHCLNEVSRPSPPLNAMVVVEDGALRIDWAPPGSDGGSPIIHYNLYKGPGFEGLQLYKSGITNLTYVDSEVEVGNTSYYAVSAVNNYGEGQTTVPMSGTIPNPESELDMLPILLVAGIAIAVLVVWLQYYRGREP